MGKISVLAASGAFFVGAAHAMAGELPTFEKSGFPITRVQVSVLGAANVQEEPPAPSLTLQGMPASPHQVAVLTPRHKTANDPGRLSAAVLDRRNVTAYRTSPE